MRVSQLTHAMGKDEEILIHDYDAPIDKALVFQGTPRGIKRDDPINKMHVESIVADDDVICVLVRKERSRQ